MKKVNIKIPFELYKIRKKRYDTKLFTKKGSTNFLFCSLCELISNGYKIKFELES